ncbi:MAG TPA: PaaI family thioesterase [Longimicrobium sp.]
MSEGDMAALKEFFETSVAFPRLAGVEIDQVQPGKAVFHLDVGDQHLNGSGAVHGGVHATLMDSAMAVALIALGLRVSTTQMTVNYLGPVTGARITCTAQLTHRTRRTALAEARIHDGDTLIALGTATFHIVEEQKD